MYSAFSLRSPSAAASATLETTRVRSSPSRASSRARLSCPSGVMYCGRSSAMGAQRSACNDPRRSLVTPTVRCHDMLAAQPMSDLADGFDAQEKALFGLCYRMTGSAADAEDLVQETFRRALEHPPRDGAAPLGPWLRKVAVNLAIDLLRKR